MAYCTLRNEMGGNEAKQNGKSVLCEFKNLYFAKLNAASCPSRNRVFYIDTETQCNLILRGSTGYVTKGLTVCLSKNKL